MDAAIVVEGLSKTYRLHRSPAGRFLDLMIGWRSGAREFVALDGISFEVRRGEGGRLRRHRRIGSSRSTDSYTVRNVNSSGPSQERT